MYFTNINLGQYVPTGSFIHRLDPRAKLFSLLLIISSVFPAKGVVALAFWVAVLYAIVRASRIQWRIILRAARPVMFLVAFTLIFNMVAASWGGNLFRWRCR